MAQIEYAASCLKHSALCFRAQCQLYSLNGAKSTPVTIVVGFTASWLRVSAPVHAGDRQAVCNAFTPPGFLKRAMLNAHGVCYSLPLQVCHTLAGSVAAPAPVCCVPTQVKQGGGCTPPRKH